jgi:hypothetical protein
MFIVLDWTKKFHVQIDASNYIIGMMLTQNVDDTQLKSPFIMPFDS